MLVGFWVAGQITDAYIVADGHNWENVWLFPAGFAAVVLVLFLVFFKSEKVSTDD